MVAAQSPQKLGATTAKGCPLPVTRLTNLTRIVNLSKCVSMGIWIWGPWTTAMVLSLETVTARKDDAPFIAYIKKLLNYKHLVKESADQSSCALRCSFAPVRSLDQEEDEMISHGIDSDSRFRTGFFSWSFETLCCSSQKPRWPTVAIRYN